MPIIKSSSLISGLIFLSVAAPVALILVLRAREQKDFEHLFI